METVTVEIDADGNPVVSVKGVAGKSCKDLTAELEKALGKVTDSSNTREFEQRGENKRQQRQ
jgi:hypothetical protein